MVQGLGQLGRPVLEHRGVGGRRRFAVAGDHDAAAVGAVQDSHLADVAHFQGIVAGIPVVVDAAADHGAEGDALDRH